MSQIFILYALRESAEMIVSITPAINHYDVKNK